MGDIYRKVKICGLRDGKPVACETVTALLDSGATVSVIGRDLATRLGGHLLTGAEQLEGRKLDLMAAEVKVKALDCGPRRKPVVVDDPLMKRAGGRAQMIVGSDYMQRTRMAILLSTEPADEGVACRRGKPARARAR